MTLTHVVCGLETLTPKTAGTAEVEMTATVGGANVEETVDDLIKFAGTGAQSVRTGRQAMKAQHTQVAFVLGQPAFAKLPV